MHPKPFVDFYAENGISPVSQDISNLEKHFEIRSALYRHLGLAPALIRGKSVLEFGPGGGFNSIYTQALRPDRYVLVEANKVGLEDATALLQKYSDGTMTPEFRECLIQDFKSDCKFDLVLCEGVIPTQKNPREFLNIAASHVDAGGVLVITCMDSVSCLSELLRRFVAFYLTTENMSLQEKIDLLVPVFSPHLGTLKGMTRSVKDWVLDNMIQPFYGPLLSITQALEALKGSFEPFGSSPHFLYDWRWHKNIHGDERAKSNELAGECYLAHVHNLIDYRKIFLPMPPAKNVVLIDCCDRICATVYEYSDTRNPELKVKLLEEVKIAAGYCRIFSREIASALLDFNKGLDSIQSDGRSADFGLFASLFGRGQQYFSLVKKSS